jgi:hypothetical protein
MFLTKYRKRLLDSKTTQNFPYTLQMYSVSFLGDADFKEKPKGPFKKPVFGRVSKPDIVIVLAFGCTVER